MRILIYNANIIINDRILTEASILINHGVIVSVSKNQIKYNDCLKINAKENYVSAGFIDLHVHGGAGYSFDDAKIESFSEISKFHAKHGTTTFLPTTLTCSYSHLYRILEIFKDAKKISPWGEMFVGLHLEGPYINPLMKGALNDEFIKTPDDLEYINILNKSNDIIRWSIAPELPGAIDMGKYLVNHSVLPSIAHTAACYKEVEHAYNQGFKHITHLYSAMSTVTKKNCYRVAGVVESAYLIDNITVELIADGSHLPASLIQLVYKIKGSSKIALVTDAIRASGIKNKYSTIGNIDDGIPVVIEDGVAKLLDRSCFAGSVATCNKLVKFVVEDAKIPLCEAIKMITSTPASIVGLSKKKGSLIKGFDADVIIFNKNYDVLMTIIKGNIVHNNFVNHLYFD